MTIPAILKPLQLANTPNADNDLFRAIALASSQDENLLRAKVADLLQGKFPVVNKQFSTYIANIRSGTESGDHLAIYALQEILDQPIILLSPYNNPIIFAQKEAHSGEPLFIYDEITKYNVFSLEEGANGRDILSNIRTGLSEYQLLTYSPEEPPIMAITEPSDLVPEDPPDVAMTARETLPEDPPLVAATVYVKQEAHIFNVHVVEEALKGFKRIITKLRGAASEAGKSPPEFMLSCFLVPEWSKGSNFDSEEYQNVKKQFLDSIKTKIAADPDLSSIRIHDFYEVDLTAGERGYLQELSALGSIADMMKTRILIDPKNANRAVLQIDTNTQISSFKELYQLTFGASKQSDSFALNACFYDEDYISAHNKIVYLTAESELALVLSQVYLAYCQAHKNDHLIPERETEKTKKNSIYSKAFTGALLQLHSVFRKEKLEMGGHKTIFPVNLSLTDLYRLTHVVVAAVNMSWRPEQGDENMRAKMLARKNLPNIEIGDADCSYACFEMAVKKYTYALLEHSTIPSMSRAEKKAAEQHAYEQFTALCNVEFDHALIRGFLKNVLENCAGQMSLLLELFIDTPRGEALMQALYGCSVNEFKCNYSRIISPPAPEGVPAAHPAAPAELYGDPGHPADQAGQLAGGENMPALAGAVDNAAGEQTLFDYKRPRSGSGGNG